MTIDKIRVIYTPSNGKPRSWFLPMICSNCFSLGHNIMMKCKKGMIFPTKSGACKRYEGWL